MKAITFSLASALCLALLIPDAPSQDRGTPARPTQERTKEQPTQRPQGERPTDKPTERPQGERPTDKPAERPQGERPTERPGTETPAQRPGTERPGTETPEQRPGTERPGTGRPDARPGNSGNTRAEAVRMLTDRVALHRERLAKIKRIRDLATAEGNRATLDRLAQMEADENAMYDREMNKAKELLGEAQFNKLMDKVGAKMDRKPAQGDKPSDRPGTKPVERPDNKPTERPQDKPTERP